MATGYTVKGLLGMSYDDFNRLTKDELRKATKTLVDAANKRIKRIEQAGESTPATRFIRRSGGLSTKGKASLSSLRREYAKAQSFLTSETGSITGWRDVMDATQKTLSEKYGIDIDQGQMKTMWKSFEKLKELAPGVTGKDIKYLVLERIADRVKMGESPDDIATAINGRIDELYADAAEQQSDSLGDLLSTRIL